MLLPSMPLYKDSDLQCKHDKQNMHTFAKKLWFIPPINSYQLPNHCNFKLPIKPMVMINRNRDLSTHHSRIGGPTTVSKPNDKPNGKINFSSAGCMLMLSGQQGSFCRVTINYTTKHDQDIWINQVQSLPNLTFKLDMVNSIFVVAAMVKTKPCEKQTKQ